MMKLTTFTLLLGATVLLFSCKKDSTNDANGNSISGRGGGGTGGGATVPFNYGIMAMNGGSLIINSANTLTGDVAYCSGVTSTTNQKIDHFNGTAYVHSNVSSFVYTAATYQPTGGIIRNDSTADADMELANSEAISFSAACAALPADYNFGAVTQNLTINAVSHNTVVNLSSFNYNSDALTLVGDPANDDGFIFNVTGSFDFSQSSINLVGIRPERVIFNFVNASNITLNKASNNWNGTILAPIGNVSYHNPANFNGSIIAKTIYVHSDFNLTQHSYDKGY